uniref:Putative secreted peptide n=1 Tax=Anopheles braziliensis TaxID=58242 RepID=A0A2M3ZMF5_9DIPT
MVYVCCVCSFLVVFLSFSTILLLVKNQSFGWCVFANIIYATVSHQYLTLTRALSLPLTVCITQSVAICSIKLNSVCNSNLFSAL